jgi:hypothetical protein
MQAFFFDSLGPALARALLDLANFGFGLDHKT